ncbi:hypothetical protein ACFCX4_05260 [Kitasatospora sp. NPDC056327]|uniref:hypothetical protein n=1 Tax=Kitasatospora sp. NPDC056327 TaxID=3345785 RepID=UPI0035E16B3F
MFKTRSPKALLAGAFGALVACIGFASLPAAQASTGTAPTQAPTGSTTEPAFPVAVEDFQHPGAERLLTERRITLKQGDGHIRLKEGAENNTQTACRGANDIFVESRLDTNGYCFTVSGTTGYLAMELPSVYMLWTQDRSISARVVVAGQEKRVNASPNQVVNVGVSIPGEPQAALVELRVTG